MSSDKSINKLLFGIGIIVTPVIIITGVITFVNITELNYGSFTITSEQVVLISRGIVISIVFLSIPIFFNSLILPYLKQRDRG